MSIISRFGLTYNDTVQVGEHTIKLPPLPKNRDEILFIDEDYENASWNILDSKGKITATRRIQYPDIWYGYLPYDGSKDVKATERYEDGVSDPNQATIWDKKNGILKSLSKEDTEKIDRIYETEIKRMRKGVFFRNGNEIEYLTPAHYTTLQWCKMSGLFKNGGYGFFFKYQRDLFYLLDHIWSLEWCTGAYISKAKKIGITQAIGGGYYVWAAITHFQWILAMMSRSQPVANGTCYAYFLHAFNSLPSALKPKVAFLSPKGGDITFGERGKTGITNEEETVLNTRVLTVPTMEHAFDSFFPMLIWSDEFPKYWTDAKKEPKKIFDENVNSIKDQLLVRGKYLITSYPPEKNDLGAQQGKEIFYNSKLSTRTNGKGSTKSGLICWHINGNESMKDLHDQYGNPLINEADRLIETELKKVEDNRDSYLATLRVYARSEKEAFDLPASGNGLPVLRLIELLHDIEEQERIDTDRLYTEGKLVWEKEEWELIQGARRAGKFCAVKFIPLTDEEKAQGKRGRLKLFHNNLAFTPNECLQNGFDEWGNLRPPVLFDRVGGVDPTQWKTNSETIEGSKNAYYTMNLPNDILDRNANSIVSKVFLSEYYYRPETPEEALEDLIKEIIFFGKAVMVEGNAPDFFNKLMKEKLGYYMFVRDKDGLIQLWDRWMGMYNEPDKKYTSIKTKATAEDKETIGEFIRLFSNYVFKPKFGEKDYGVTIKSSDLIKSAINLDIENTKKSDCFMAAGYTLKAVYCYMDIMAQMKDEDYTQALPHFLNMLTRK